MLWTLPYFGASSVCVGNDLKLGVGIMSVYYLVTCAKSYRALKWLMLCSWINTSCCWMICTKNDSQQFILIPLLQVFNSFVVCSAFPYSCLLFNMCKA